MVAKYFVWGSGAWRELDMTTGAVRGWRRRARFVFVRRGRLQLARRRPVLRALRALARDEPSAAADGPRLAHLRNTNNKQSSRRVQPVAAPAPAPPPPPPLHCCAHYNGCMSHHMSVSTQRETSVSTQRETGVQCGNAGVGSASGGGVTLTLQRPAHSSGEEFVEPRPRPGPRRSKSRSAQLHAETIDLFRLQPIQDVSELKKATEEEIVDSKQDRSSPPRAKRPRLSCSSEVSDDLCKELVISEEDLAALRGFVARKRRPALARFDADERYRRALCYAINPLVTLRRCGQLERLQRLQAPGHAHADTDADKENKAVPQASTSREARRKPRPNGTERRDNLRRSLRVQPNAEGEQKAQAQNKQASPMKQVSPKKVPPKSGSPTKAPAKKAVSPMRAPPTTAMPLTKAPPAVKATGAHAAISKRPSAFRSKEYSSLEDHCIVSWLESGSRASQVNGNRLWQELQSQYPRLTGQERSWHSLRNRYLRYILPALGTLGLAPAHVSRLRAAAATGCIKHASRPAPARRASIFQQDSVRSASARRPRPDRPAAPGPGRPAAPGPDRPASRPAEAQDNDTDVGASRVTRRSRGPPEKRASPPPSERDTPSTSKANDERSSPRRPSRGPLQGKRERRHSHTPSSSCSEDDAPLASKHDGRASSLSRRPRGRPPGKRESPHSPTPSTSSSEQDEPSDIEVKAAAAERRRSLRYSEVTRRFAARHRPGAGSGSPGPAGAPRPAGGDSSRSSDDFAPKRPVRSRKLFNPNAKL